MTATIHETMPEQDYYSHPALSVSDAKRLLKSPAHYRWAKANPTHSQAFDFGHYVHAQVLGGAEIVVIDAPDWRGKAARDTRDEARAAGAIPVLAHEAEQGDAMVEAVRDHLEVAGLANLFAPGHGQAEVSMVWDDHDHGIQRRARLDWLHEAVPGKPRMVVDLKTAATAEPAAFATSAAKFGYHLQAAWYTAAVEAATGTDRVGFWFVVVEKSPPHAVSIVQLDADSMELGRRAATEAIRRYTDCVATDTWPAYGYDVTTISLPRWAHYEHEEY